MLECTQTRYLAAIERLLKGKIHMHKQKLVHQFREWILSL